MLRKLHFGTSQYRSYVRFSFGDLRCDQRNKMYRTLAYEAYRRFFAICTLAEMTAFANSICHSLTNDLAFPWRLAEAGIGARIALCKWSNLKKMLDSRMVSLAADLYHRSLRYFSQAEESHASPMLQMAGYIRHKTTRHSNASRSTTSTTIVLRFITLHRLSYNLTSQLISTSTSTMTHRTGVVGRRFLP
jgi:hypothetical protein